MRRRILLLVVGMTTLVVLAFAVPLTILIRQNAYTDGRDALRSESRTISLGMFRLRDQNGTITPAQITALLDSFGHERAASVELPGGTVLGTQPPGGTAAAPAVPARTGAGGQPSAGFGPGAPDTGSVGYRGGQLATLAIPQDPGTGQPGSNSGAQYVIRVWAGDGTLRSGQTKPLLVLGGVVVLLLAVGVVAGEVLTRRIVRPLVDTATTAQALSAGDTAARAPTDGPPEVAEVGRSLNRLADRIDQLIADERETTADLSHRLRTPMTALRLDAEALRDPDEAERIGTHVSALERMLTAVIHAARRGQREGRMPSSDATAVVGGRVEFWSALAEDQGRPMVVDLPDASLAVRAGEEDLAAAVDALLENVIAHTPEGTAFEVHLLPGGPGAVLEISDDGPGLPEDASVRGRSDRGSSGLGLDIARRCAEASGGSMTLGRTAGGGARIRLEFAAT